MLDKIILFINNPTNLYQAILFLVSFFISFFISVLTKKTNQKDAQITFWKKYIISNMLPILFLLFSYLFYLFFLKFFNEAKMLYSIVQIAFFWLISAFLKEYIKKHLLILVAYISISTLIIFNIFGFKQDETILKFSSINISLHKILMGIFVLSIILWASDFFLKKIQKKIEESFSLEKNKKILIIKAISILVYFIAILITLNILDINLSSLAFIGGTIAIGLGFGLQKITANFISGIILLLDNAIREGDLIEIDENTIGHIKDIGIRKTIIEDFDGKEIMVPNEDFITNKLINWTHSDPKTRVRIIIGVSYSSDLDKVKELLREVLENNDKISKEEGFDIFLKEFADSCVNFLLFFWLDDVNEGRLRTKSQVLFEIWHKFKENNIEIPFPQRDVYIKKSD